MQWLELSFQDRSPAWIARLEALSSLTVTAAFHIHAYRRTDA